MNYITDELDKLVDDWITFRYQMDRAKSKEDEDKIKSYDMDLMDHCLIPKLPKLSLSIILKILEKDSSDEVMSVLAAGELEDLLSLHGEEIFGLIEELAKKNPKFKKLLGGVWQGGMSDEFYKRIMDIAGGEEARW